MNPRTYTLIAYKSDGHNTCRQCVMESWSSDFQLSTCLTAEDVVKEAVRILDRKPEMFHKRVFGHYQLVLVAAINNEPITWTDLLENSSGHYSSTVDVDLEITHPEVLAEVEGICAAIRKALPVIP